MEFLTAAQKLWWKVNLRGMIVMSLFLQVILIFLAPIRKRTSNWLIMILTWSAYLVADWVADYAFGLIAKAQFNGGTSDEDYAYGDLLAFWAPFLLLHLGGPDTITAFALEDNELWRRHFLNLLFQLCAAGYVFYQSLPNDKLIVPTILVFIGGIIKYIERTRALYLGSVRKFRGSFLTPGDAGPNYAKLMEEYSSKAEANIPAKIEMMPEPDMEFNGEENKTSERTQPFELDDRVVAFTYFSTFKGLLVDLIFSFHQRNESMNFFRSRTAKDAFRVIEAELNFFYDVLYTKAVVVHRPIGYLFRAISIGSVITAFVFFYVLNKDGFHEYDIQITYALLLGAVGLEFVALSMLIFSDWTIALLGRPEKVGRRSHFKNTFMEFLLKIKLKEGSLFALPILHDRWSKSIPQYDLIDSRLRRWPKWIEKLLDYICLGELFDDLKSGRQVPYKDKLGKLIFDELTRKSPATGDSKHIKELCAARGKWALENIETQDRNFKDLLPDLLPFVHEVDYGESLLLWHIATKLCDNEDDPDESATKLSDNEDDPDDHAKSKILSDYMLHLMIKQPDMMSVVAGIGQIRFRDTCAEVDKFIEENISDGSKADENISDWRKAKEIICNIFDRSKRKKRKQIVCKNLRSVPTKVKPVDVKGDRSKSALFDACILAEVLLRIEKKSRWEIMSRVWVELLGYAAIHCRPYNHAQQLSKGGELITLVWLLMVQLGLSEQFQIVEGHARAKLIVQK